MQILGYAGSDGNGSDRGAILQLSEGEGKKVPGGGLGGLPRMYHDQETGPDV
jgi:hypothetical protein